MGKTHLEVKTACWQAHIAWELSKQAARAHLARTRAYKEWASGERCWYWRDQPRDRAGTVIRSRHHGMFCGPGMVLLQQRRIDDTTGERHRRGIVWVIDGDRLIRCSPAHLRIMQDNEKVMDIVEDSQDTNFEDIIRI